MQQSFVVGIGFDGASRICLLRLCLVYGRLIKYFAVVFVKDRKMESEIAQVFNFFFAFPRSIHAASAECASTSFSGFCVLQDPLLLTESKFVSQKKQTEYSEFIIRIHSTKPACRDSEMARTTRLRRAGCVSKEAPKVWGSVCARGTCAGDVTSFKGRNRKTKVF